MRFLVSLTGVYVALAIAVLPAFAQEGKKGDTIRIRFLDNREETVEVVDWDEKGIRVKMRDVPVPVYFEWFKLEPETAEILKGRFLGRKTTVIEEGVWLDGVRIRTANRVVEGLLVPNTPVDEFHVKTFEGVSVFKAADVIAKEPIRVRITQVYTSEELYRILMDRVQPSDAAEWDRLGAELIRMGLRDRAAQAFNMGELLRRPERLEGQIYVNLVRLRNRLEDLTLRKTLFEAQEQFLSGKYQEAIEIVEGLERTAREDSMAKELQRLRTELYQLRDQSREDQIVSEWSRATEAILRLKAFDRRLGYNEAAAYVTHELTNDVLRAVSDRFNITRGDSSARVVWDRRSSRVVLKHSYEDASWIVERPELGSPGAWYERADDAARFRLLKGLLIEKHYVVVKVVQKNCPTCGGTGGVDMSRYPNATGGICPVCLGLKHERSIFYR